MYLWTLNNAQGVLKTLLTIPQVPLKAINQTICIYFIYHLDNFGDQFIELSSLTNYSSIPQVMCGSLDGASHVSHSGFLLCIIPSVSCMATEANFSMTAISMLLFEIIISPIDSFT